jgi:hypothetical protein
MSVLLGLATCGAVAFVLTSIGFPSGIAVLTGAVIGVCVGLFLFVLGDPQ